MVSAEDQPTVTYDAGDGRPIRVDHSMMVAAMRPSPGSPRPILCRQPYLRRPSSVSLRVPPLSDHLLSTLAGPLPTAPAPGALGHLLGAHPSCG